MHVHTHTQHTHTHTHTHTHRVTDSEAELLAKNTRSHTQPSKRSLQELTLSRTKSRAKTYGSYEDSKSHTSGRLLNKVAAGVEGGKRDGVREAVPEDAMFISLHSQHNVGGDTTEKVVTPDGVGGHSTAKERQ